MLPPYTTYLIDLDGVIYRGATLVPGAKEFVDWLERTGKKYLFLTNNSFASEQQVLDKLQGLGIHSSLQHVLGAGQAAIRQIARRFPNGSIHLIGERPLYEIAQAYGLKIVNSHTEHADAVLVGLDREFTYAKLTEAILTVRNGAEFIAINRDPLLPVADGFIAGTGTMVAAIEAGSSTAPEVIGKPQPALLVEAMQTLGSTPDETVMIGDGLDVDILAGKAASTHTLLVLSGRASRATLEHSTIQPDLVYEDLAAVLKDVED
ncbi:HAD-IIA family hydrolase [Ktedonospora formicarum]|uniref:TIGR01457 family HAD-type hydrolase n=1 Tax=Ktedonospora formicarum TaxID=2778364 RepID=A0A8J3HZM3_9CHLR|nr:HAD-IIA family hydrolase [Ktedonospora formicarum]GHO43928.1 TIGR01457 family HAD-type hydrolase [Ktedonospora formicarum]